MCIRVRRRVHGEYFLFLQRFQIEFVLRLMSTTERLTTNKLGSDAQTLIGSSTTKLSPGLNRGKVTTYRSSKVNSLSNRPSISPKLSSRMRTKYHNESKLSSSISQKRLLH
eukprot:TRINITY_DN2137_c0_g1_i2.p2 TRINITY_DN2137_c0_g1~~TRINITY_DN2137_c0_g1_i2.p2  ORF type:complete len:111 (-),score=4.49 TRINITY_DN2137_c0_g1_i2:669-1001(-)